MKFTDIIALAKQGFTPADIREFMKLDTEQEQPAEDPASAEPKQPAEDPAPAESKQPAEDLQQEPKQPAEDPAPAESKQPAEDLQQEPDYKQLYEEEKAKRQAAARKQEVATDDSKSVEDTLLDIAKMYI